jgi:hypothetical protein
VAVKVNNWLEPGEGQRPGSGSEARDSGAPTATAVWDPGSSLGQRDVRDPASDMSYTLRLPNPTVDQTGALPGDITESSVARRNDDDLQKEVPAGVRFQLNVHPPPNNIQVAFNSPLHQSYVGFHRLPSWH